MDYQKTLESFLIVARTNPKKIYSWVGILLPLSVALGIIIDALIPFGPLWNILRAFVGVIGGAALFAGVYTFVSNGSHAKKIANLEEGLEPPETMRESLTYKTRLKLGVIAGAIILGVVLFASQESLVYTLTGIIAIATTGWLLMFIRKTPEEAKRAKLGLLDARDREIRIIAEAERRQKKKKKSGKNKDDDDDEPSNQEEDEE